MDSLRLILELAWEALRYVGSLVVCMLFFLAGAAVLVLIDTLIPGHIITNLFT